MDGFALEMAAAPKFGRLHHNTSGGRYRPRDIKKSGLDSLDGCITIVVAFSEV
jgi:hypothetical protein